MKKPMAMATMKKAAWSLFLAVGISAVLCSSNVIADCPDADIYCSTSCSGKDIGSFKVGRCLHYTPLPHCYVCNDSKDDRAKWAQECHDKFAPNRDLKDIHTCYKPIASGSRLDCYDSEGKWCGSYGGE